MIVEFTDRWTLSIHDTVPRTVHLQAQLQSLEQLMTPCAVFVTLIIRGCYGMLPP
jgi:hypothetical protein